MKSFLSRIATIWRPHPGQLEFLLNPAKIKVLACGRRWGKTDACAIAILAEVLGDAVAPRRKKGPALGHVGGVARPSAHVILAPTLDQARILFDRVVELATAVASHIGFDLAGFSVRTSPYPRLVCDGHTVVARSGHLGRSLRGHEATHIVVDEAAYVPEQLVTEVAMPMLATTEGSLTLISTPRGLNHFWRFFAMGKPHETPPSNRRTPPAPLPRQAGGASIWSRRAPSSENPLVSRAFLEAQRQLISERAFRVEYEAEFLDLAGTVFRMEAIERCVVPRLTLASQPPFFIGVDWARYEDYTAIAVVCGARQRAVLLELHRFHAMSWTEQLARVRAIVQRFAPARVLCDQTGMGGDVLLEELRKGLSSAAVTGYSFTSANKARVIEGLVWMLENGALEMEPDPQLLRELQHFEASVSPSGNRKLMARSGYHDDLVIALALACHELPRNYNAGALVGQARRFSRMRTRYDVAPTVRFCASPSGGGGLAARSTCS